MTRTLLLMSTLIAVLSLSCHLFAESAALPAKGSEQGAVKTAPVMLERVAIFSIPAYHRYSADERAAKISERIAKAAQDYSLRIDTITTEETDISTEVVAGQRFIMSVYDTDARTAGVTRQQLASQHAARIRAAIDRYRQERAPKAIAHGIIMCGIATAALLVALLLVRMLFRWLVTLSAAQMFRPIRLQKFELLNLEEVRALFGTVMRAIRLVLVLVLLYIYTTFVLDALPWSRPFSNGILQYVLVPVKTMQLKVVEYIPNLIFLIVLAVVSKYALKFMKVIAIEVERGNITFAGFYREWAKPTYKIARFLFIAFVAVVAFPYFPGSQSPAFKGISIFIGVLLSLGSTSTVSNVVAGLDMTYRRAYLQGDWIKVGELIGEVTRTRLLVTHLRTFKNEEVVFPNAVLLNSHVINYTSLARLHGLILHTSVTIGYTTPWRQVHALLLQAAERTPGVLREPLPFVLQTGLDDFYIRYELNAYTDVPEEMPVIYSHLHQNIQDLFNEFGVQIMSPHYMLDPACPATVPKEQWYAPPATPPVST
ncbi:mechanosensitive ion channel family protein [Geomonas sp. RF6]|uniref:mechanosensitive ion channel family protein n=1 Tax=Geomonas sp. RF6 TaxID=2897342 RepID=UPI001E60A172|nr:mechanosensitive ion channel family protein [Geomonas sp. RF6]UFS68875.1 mechanosensitive ion channel family protein [Geomonas sp. RF6]